MARGKQTQTAKAKKASGAKSTKPRTRPPQAGPKAPNTLTRRAKVEMVAQRLHELQRQQFDLDMLQEINGRKDDDPVDGAQPDQEGKLPTYGDRRTILTSAEARLVKKYADLIPEVQAFLDGLAAAEGAGPATN